MASTPRLSLIAAMDRHRLIGVKSEHMPWHLPDDLRHFKRITLGKPVIMGRRIHASIGRVLPGRLNIVITRGGSVHPVPGQLVTAASLDEALQIATDWLAAKSQLASSDARGEIIVIAGADVYAQAIDRAECLYLSEIDAAYNGDNHFPPFFHMQPGWIKLHRESHRAAASYSLDTGAGPRFAHDYAYVTYGHAR